MKTFAFITFGCKVNQYESQALRERFSRKGLTEVGSDDGADLLVINTCTVTESATSQAQRDIRRLARRFPFSEITVTGCAADSHREEFLGLPGVRRVVGHDQKAALCDDPRLAPSDSAPSIFDLTISRFDQHTRAFLKVEDGCDLNCSFCIIPKVRGTAVSRPLDAAVDEARRLVGNGYQEIVLTGVHLGSYGKDLSGRPMLADLVERLLAVPGLKRLRLSSLEANELSDPLIALMAADRRFCPHLHLPLQSGDDEVLRAMRRRYNARQYLAACERVAERVPEPSFTADVIVGFPGETAAQFENTLGGLAAASASRGSTSSPTRDGAGRTRRCCPTFPAREEGAASAGSNGWPRADGGLCRPASSGREVEVLVERTAVTPNGI
jgi:threonylcarbamoyladenosine tRNA methylthiotransferase MtaB